jgi:hypothetical protein
MQKPVCDAHVLTRRDVLQVHGQLVCYIDLARGYVMAGDPAGGLRCLQAARRVAPQQTRHHPMVRETVLSIASARRGREELSLFASWLGLS